MIPYEFTLHFSDSNSTCIDNGTLMQNGSSWFRPDCTQCRCEGGLTFCVPVGRMPQNSSICRPLPPDCTFSTVPAGECCPVCVSKLVLSIGATVLFIPYLLQTKTATQIEHTHSNTNISYRLADDSLIVISELFMQGTMFYEE